MRSEYKRDIHNNYLVLENDRQVEETSYPVRMLLANALPLFLKCRLQGMDGKMLFYYEITSRQALEDFYENKKFSFEDLQLLFGSFVQLIEKMAEYLLNPDQLVLEPEFIFLDVEKKNLYFCYLPGYERPIREQFQSLTEYVLPKLNHEDSQAVMLGYGIYRRALEEVFQLDHIKEAVYQKEESEQKKREEKKEQLFLLTESEEPVGKEEPIVNTIEENPFLQVEKGRVSNEDRKNWKKYFVYLVGCVAAAVLLFLLIIAENKGYLPSIRVELKVGIIILVISFLGFIGFLLRKQEEREENNPKRKQPETSHRAELGQEERKTEILQKPKRIRQGDCGETVILSEEPVKGPATLVSREPGELATIYLQEELIVIGKLESAADVVIDLPTVSRLHAKIRKRGEDYFLSDLNSRNGTAVNGRMLKVDEEYLLQEEDEVDFAQARYIFLK